MKSRAKHYLTLILTLLALSLPAQAQNAAPATPVGSAAIGSSAPLIGPPPLAPIATKLGETLQTLVTGSSTPQAGAPAAANTNDEDTIGQVSDSFATDILDTLAQAVDHLEAKSAWANAQKAWPDFKDWLQHQSDDPRRAAVWGSIAHDLLIVIGVPLLIGLGVWFLLMPVRIDLRKREPESLPGRIGLLLSLFASRIVPMFVFMGAALLLLDQNETHRLPRFVMLNVVYALSLGYFIHEILVMVFAPAPHGAPQARLLAFSSPRAAAAYRWFNGFNFVIVYGYFLVDMAEALRVPATSLTLFQNILALILTLMAIAVIFRTRSTVAAILRGRFDEEDDSNFMHALRAWLARHWHSLATLYLAISLGVTLLGIDDGLALMLRGTILTICTLIAARFAFVGIDAYAMPRNGGTPQMHRQILAFFLRPAVWIAASVAIAVIWGFRFSSFIATPSGQRISGSVISIALTFLILTMLYEMINASIDRHLNKRDKISKQPVASARARTLLPMMRNTAFILFSAAAVLATLSVVGVNIGPVLAGAGVVGVAIGFGSQTLVKDFLTGLFIVVENTIAVGDVVKISGFGGVVEAISIRTIRLRDSDGSLHILPFSEVTKITNMTRGFAYALVNIGVAYESDLDHVMTVMREVGAALQEDPIFKRVIMEPIEVLGVDNLADSAVIIQARMRTRPGKQWDVRRQLLLKIKQRFDKEGIEIPYPTQETVIKPHKSDKK